MSESNQSQTLHAFTDDVLGNLDAVGIADAIRQGQISAAEAIEAAIDRVESVNGRLNAVVERDYERARSVAAKATVGPLAGVPTMIKENTDVAGLPCRHGSLAVSDRPASSNSEVTKQVLGTGLVCLGKTSMPEFGLNATTEFVGRPPTRNPWNTDYSCGASSGGSAALVAAGALAIAHANDGGGSIRIPAAACGLVGLKPTRHRLASAKGLDEAPVNIVADGVVTRTVRDTATFFAAAERYRPAADLPEIGLVEGPSDRRLQVGLIIDDIDGNEPDSETATAVRDMAARLEKLGHTVSMVGLPVRPGFDDAFVHYWALAAFASIRLGKRQYGPGFDRKKVDQFTKGLQGLFLKAPWRTPGAIKMLKQSEAVYRQAFTAVDVILSPTVSMTTPKLGFLSPELPFGEVFPRLRRYAAYTALNNGTGGPAIALPLAQTSDGRPLSVHFSADHGDERTLLELAFELESEIGFASIAAS